MIIIQINKKNEFLDFSNFCCCSILLHILYLLLKKEGAIEHTRSACEDT